QFYILHKPFKLIRWFMSHFKFYSAHFCLDLPKNFATHHFYGSWLPDRTKSYKENAVEIYFNEQLESLENITHSKNFLKTLATRIKIKDLFKLIRYFIQYKLK
ncbi:glycosyl transferase, partial [Acinetobacter baumannii]|nr:glycosyl transferase [Acinetobacter baumannii]